LGSPELDHTSWSLSELGEGDWPDAVALTHAAGWHDSVTEWQDMAPCSRVLGVRDPAGVLRGTGARCDFGALYTIAKVVVHPDCRRRGLGERLVRAALELPRAPGATVLLVATSLGRAIYVRLGFETIGVLHSCRGVPRRDAEPRAVALDDSWIGAAAALDAEASGGDRRALIARRWASAEARMGLIEKGALVAFGLRVSRAGSWLAGPIHARREEDAIDVLRALVPGDGREGRVDVPGEHAAMRRTAHAMGLTDESPRDEMTLGGAPPPGRRSLRFAPTSLAYG
jgi:ribosomal protein S18 acetylase RimI-like enzyme